MKRIVYKECPYCKSQNIAYGYQVGEADVFADIRGGVFGTHIEHTICRDCGSIIYSRVLKTDFLKDKSETSYEIEVPEDDETE